MTTPRRWWSVGWWSRAVRRAAARTGTARSRPLSVPPPLGRRPRPVFVGGTGRSGTTIVGRLLGAHPANRMIPVEVKFITAPGGLCDLVEGQTSYRAFRRAMLGRWFDRTLADGRRRGLWRLTSRELLERALDALRDEIEVDRWRAGAEFAHRLLDPPGAEAQHWIEMTPRNIIAADRLLRLFPDARLVHVVRDGRDVACSVASQPWGPNDVDDALEWWARRLERSLAACDRLPEDRLLLVQLEALVDGAREREYARLLAFLGLADDPAIRAYFETSVLPDRAHSRRWVRQVPPERLAAFEAHHAALVDGLRARGRGVPTWEPSRDEG